MSEENLIDLERARLDAMHRLDLAALGTMLHDQFTFTHMNGMRESKDEFLTRMGLGTTIYHPAKLDDVIVRQAGNALVLNGNSTLKVEVKDTGQTFDMHNRFSSIWVDEGSGWKALAYHSTPMSV